MESRNYIETGAELKAVAESLMPERLSLAEVGKSHAVLNRRQTQLVELMIHLETQMVFDGETVGG